MAHEVFISYGHEDKLVADAACARLEARGIRCWIAPRDTQPGRNYGESIGEAIRASRALVLIFSNHANLSEYVSKEVERAVSNGVPVVPLRIENVAPTGALDFFIGSVHWLDALTPPMEQHLERLADSLEGLIGESGKKREERPQPTPLPSPVPPPARSTLLYAAAGVIAVLLAVVVLKLMEQGESPRTVAPPAREAARPAEAGPAPREEQPASAGITGCWSWFNTANLRMQSDGRVTGAPIEGRWRANGGNGYSLHWPVMVDRVTLSADGRTLTGTNQYGVQVSGTSASRVQGSLAGGWQWNGAPAIAGSDGSLVVGPFRGRWRAVGGGTYEVSWPNDPPVDRLTLSADSLRLAGQNNFGLQISGTRVACP